MAHQHCAQGKGALNPSKGAREGLVEARLGLDGLDVVGAVRGRLVLGLLVLHLATPNFDRFFIGYLFIWRDARRRRDSDAGANPSMRL